MKTIESKNKLYESFDFSDIEDSQEEAKRIVTNNDAASLQLHNEIFKNLSVLIETRLGDPKIFKSCKESWTESNDIADVAIRLELPNYKIFIHDCYFYPMKGFDKIRRSEIYLKVVNYLEGGLAEVVCLSEETSSVKFDGKIYRDMKGLSREELVWLDRFNQALENAIAEGPYRFVEEFYDFLNAKSDLDARIAKSVIDLVTYMVKNGIARESISGAKSLDFRKVLGPKTKLKFKNGKIFYNSGVVKHAYDPEFFPIYYDVKDWSRSRFGWNDVLVGMGHDIRFATLHNRSNIVYWPESFEELLELPNQIEEAIKRHRANQ